MTYSLLQRLKADRRWIRLVSRGKELKGLPGSAIVFSSNATHGTNKTMCFTKRKEFHTQLPNCALNANNPQAWIRTSALGVFQILSITILLQFNSKDSNASHNSMRLP